MSIDDKIKSLIAVGASITANCQPCLKHHEAKARENGADDEAISEAIGVEKAVRSGAASHMDKFISSICKCSASTCDSATANKGCC